MKQLHKLNAALILLVFAIMVTSGTLAGTLGWLLYSRNIKPGPFYMLFFLPVISVVFGTMLSMVVSKRVLKPLNDLIAATREIAKGNLDVKVNPSISIGEIGELISSFNNMTTELSSIELFRNDFINNFSHEFKTPIVSIRGFAKRLLDDHLSEAQRKEFAAIIVSESDRLTKMSSNVLLLTKYENQEMVTEKSTFSLDEQLRNCLLLFEKEWSEKNLDLQLDLTPINYYGDQEMLSQVWTNLIANAVKFSHPAGSLEIRCYPDGSAVKVKIADSGIGMDDETCRHIFEKFYQGDSAHASLGNGLGLSIVKRILDLCGGQITVKSKKDVGTTFTVKLPMQQK